MGPIRKIQYNCKQATFLIEKKLTDGLSLRENIELRIHLVTCSVCRTFDRQSLLINQMVKNMFNHNNTDAHLDEQFKQYLKNRIEEELNKN